MTPLGFWELLDLSFKAARDAHAARVHDAFRPLRLDTLRKFNDLRNWVDQQFDVEDELLHMGMYGLPGTWAMRSALHVRYEMERAVRVFSSSAHYQRAFDRGTLGEAKNNVTAGGVDLDSIRRVWRAAGL